MLKPRIGVKKTIGERDKVRETVLPLWKAIRKEWTFASQHIADAFRTDPDLGIHARGRIVEILYGMIAQTRRIDFALEKSGLEQMPEDRQALAQYFAYRVLTGKLSPEQAGNILSGIDWRKVASTDEGIAALGDPVQRLALSRSLPDWLAQLLLKEYEDEADALAAALNTRPPLTIRVNTLRSTREAVRVLLAKNGIDSTPTKFAREGLILDTFVSVYNSSLYREGQIEIQDEASQLVAELVAPSSHSLVLDACAGAGGKTLALGALMKNAGKLVALDIHSARLDELRRRARRAGLHNVQATAVADGENVHSLEGKAERVLIDVPCSGLGALRHNPEARWRMTAADLSRFPMQQLEIARNALKYCKPGGRAIYSTCTINSAENERVVEQILKELTQFRLVPIKEIFGRSRAEPISDSTETFLKMLPHRHGTDGFFAAVLRRTRGP